MKITGIILIVLGAIALLGSLVGGSNPIGGLFFLALGIFLVQRARQKKEDAERKRKWENVNDNQ